MSRIFLELIIYLNYYSLLLKSTMEIQTETKKHNSTWTIRADLWTFPVSGFLDAVFLVILHFFMFRLINQGKVLLFGLVNPLKSYTFYVASPCVAQIKT